MDARCSGILAAFILLLLNGLARAQPAQPAAAQPRVAADQTPPPSGMITDRELTQKVRKALADDPALSSVARRVKVNTENRKVTLKGWVESGEQRQAVE